MKFKVINSGDWSVGISGFEINVEFSKDTDAFDDEFSDRFKEFILAELEGHNGKTEVFTEKEWTNLIDHVTMQEENLNEGD